MINESLSWKYHICLFQCISKHWNNSKIKVLQNYNII